MYKIKVIMSLLWWQIKITLLFTNLLTMILKTMLRLIPDKLFTCNLNIHNDKGNIDILHVHTEKNTITNKFKFLLKNFWRSFLSYTILQP